MSKINEWDGKSSLRNLKNGTWVPVAVAGHMCRINVATTHRYTTEGVIPTAKGARGKVVQILPIKDMIALLTKKGVAELYLNRMIESGYNTKPIPVKKEGKKPKKKKKVKKEKGSKAKDKKSSVGHEPIPMRKAFTLEEAIELGNTINAEAKKYRLSPAKYTELISRAVAKGIFK